MGLEKNSLRMEMMQPDSMVETYGGLFPCSTRINFPQMAAEMRPSTENYFASFGFHSDFMPPIDSLSKPIKRNNWDSTGQERAQRSLVCATWDGDRSVEQDTLWTARKLPLGHVKYRCAILCVNPIT